MKKDQYLDIALSTGSGALGGASLGLPGAIVGGALGLGTGIASAIGENKMQDFNDNLEAERMDRYRGALSRNSSDIYGFKPRGNNLGGYYRLGGRLRGRTNKFSNISSTGKLVLGAKHEQGGVKLENGAEVEGGEVIIGDKVYSAVLGDGTESFADKALRLSAKQGKLEEAMMKARKDRDKYKYNSASRLSDFTKEELEGLFETQESLKEGSESNGGMFRLGGSMNNPPDIPPIYVSDKNDPRYRAYQDSLAAYNYGEDSYRFAKSIMKTSMSQNNAEFKRYFKYQKGTKFPSKYKNLDPIESQLFDIINYREIPNSRIGRLLGKEYPFQGGDPYFTSNGKRYIPVGVFWDRYKKPVQEVILKPSNNNISNNYTRTSSSASKRKPKPISPTQTILPENIDSPDPDINVDVNIPTNYIAKLPKFELYGDKQLYNNWYNNSLDGKPIGYYRPKGGGAPVDIKFEDMQKYYPELFNSENKSGYDYAKALEEITIERTNRMNSGRKFRLGGDLGDPDNPFIQNPYNRYNMGIQAGQPNENIYDDVWLKGGARRSRGGTNFTRDTYDPNALELNPTPTSLPMESRSTKGLSFRGQIANRLNSGLDRLQPTVDGAKNFMSAGIDKIKEGDYSKFKEVGAEMLPMLADNLSAMVTNRRLKRMEIPKPSYMPNVGLDKRVNITGNLAELDAARGSSFRSIDRGVADSATALAMKSRVNSGVALEKGKLHDYAENTSRSIANKELELNMGIHERNMAANDAYRNMKFAKDIQTNITNPSANTINAVEDLRYVSDKIDARKKDMLGMQFDAIARGGKGLSSNYLPAMVNFDENRGFEWAVNNSNDKKTYQEMLRSYPKNSKTYKKFEEWGKQQGYFDEDIIAMDDYGNIDFTGFRKPKLSGNTFSKKIGGLE